MNTTLLLEAARLSGLVYQPPATIKQAEPGCQFFDSDETGAQAILVPRDTFAFVVWRGTEFTSAPLSAEWWRDLLANVRSRRTQWQPGGKVHRGYAGAVLSISTKIERAALRLNLPVVATGHSMGGVTATIFGSGSICPVISFGAPAPGNGAFWRTLAHVTRVVLAHDPAPKHPQPWLGYRQSERFVHLWPDGRVEDKTWKTWTHGKIVPGTNRGIVKAGHWHSITAYEAALELASQSS